MSNLRGIHFLAFPGRDYFFVYDEIPDIFLLPRCGAPRKLVTLLLLYSFIWFDVVSKCLSVCGGNDTGVNIRT